MEDRLTHEWLEADGLGGFAMGTAAGVRTRRYHALLQVATTPPTGRMVLVNGFDAWVESASGRAPFSSQCYAPGVIDPDGANHIESFTIDPWPQWVYALPNGIRIQQQIFVPKGSPSVVVAWKLLSKGNATLRVRPFLSGRDYHSTHHENSAFRFKSVQMDSRVIWQPYAGVPPVSAISNARYESKPEWYRNFLYQQEQARGLDAVEDLASPGEFMWKLGPKEAVLIFSAEGVEGTPLPDSDSPLAMLKQLRDNESQRRKKFPSRLHRAADDYLVKRGNGKTIIAGYPWFTDWGRDTFIAIRGLCLAGGRLSDAEQILTEWADVVSDGMLPNLFPDGRATPEYNSIDASLWYVVAVHEFLAASKTKYKKKLTAAVLAILHGYKNGTRFNIHMDSDGLIAGGVDGVALTWMDARVDGWAITPRVGKPVEVQALWINALKIGSAFDAKWERVFDLALAAFHAKFWNQQKGFLNDVVDVNGTAGAVDASFRPNQILAVGGLPFPLIDGDRAQRVVNLVEQKLWTPLGLRSLAPDEPGYTAHYEGNSAARDSAYHQGTVWPWLMGPFVEAWVYVHGETSEVLDQAHPKFLKPLLEHLDHAGLNGISEITDAQAPFTPRGCPFQAWSVAEVLRLSQTILKPAAREKKHATHR